MRTINENEMEQVTGGGFFDYVVEKVVEAVVEYVKEIVPTSPEI